MGLIGNCFRANIGAHLPLCDIGSRVPGAYATYGKLCNSRSQDGSSAVLAGVAVPTGSYPPDTFHPPQEAGEMALRADGEGDLDATLIPSRLLSVDFYGTGDFEATAGLVVSMSVDMDGTGSLEVAISGRVEMSVDFTGVGELEAALTAVADMIVDMQGTGDLDAALTAIASLSVDITVVGAGLTIDNVGPAVWAALAAANNDPGTMGAKLNAASSAGDPWATELPGTYTGDEAGAIVGQRLLTLAKFLGLK